MANKTSNQEENQEEKKKKKSSEEEILIQDIRRSELSNPQTMKDILVRIVELI